MILNRSQLPNLQQNNNVLLSLLTMAGTKLTVFKHVRMSASSAISPAKALDRQVAGIIK